MEIESNPVITFPKGLIGFPNEKRYKLLSAGIPNFHILQAYEESHKFIVCNPKPFFPTYNPQPHIQELDEIGVHQLKDSQILIIINKREERLTANLLGPIFFNKTLLIGKNVVLPQKEYQVAHHLPFMEN